MNFPIMFTTLCYNRLNAFVSLFKRKRKKRVGGKDWVARVSRKGIELSYTGVWPDDIEINCDEAWISFRVKQPQSFLPTHLKQTPGLQ
jgi:hypothetical protein